MAKKKLRVIGMAGTDFAAAPSKGQKAFNALIGEIEKRRVALADWEAFDAVFRRKVNDELVPLRQRYDALGSRLVQRLDQSNDIKGLTKAERQTIAELIVRIAGDLLASINDASIAEIYRRYDTAAAPTAPIDVADISQPVTESPVTDSPEDEQEARERIRREARDAYHAKRRKTPREDAAAQRARAEQAEVHLSIRQVYRKLASALHPDRETDPAERERKDGLMQRVNRAYASRSLLDLLEIQLEMEHIDQASLDRVSDASLRHWNAILKEQLDGLDQELVEIEADYRARCGMSSSTTVSTKSVRRALTADITHLREASQWFERDLRAFDDVERLKSWLKDMKSAMAAQ